MEIVRGTTKINPVTVILEAEADSANNIASERIFLSWADDTESESKLKMVKRIALSFFGSQTASELRAARLTPNSQAIRLTKWSDIYVTPRTQFYYQYCYNDSAECDLLIERAR